MKNEKKEEWQVPFFFFCIREIVISDLLILHSLFFILHFI